MYLGGQDRVVVKRPLRNDKDVGSNPTATRNENWTLGGPLHRRCRTGSEWKTSGVEAELGL